MDAALLHALRGHAAGYRDNARIADIQGSLAEKSKSIYPMTHFRLNNRFVADTSLQRALPGRVE